MVIPRMEATIAPCWGRCVDNRVHRWRPVEQVADGVGRRALWRPGRGPSVEGSPGPIGSRLCDPSRSSSEVVDDPIGAQGLVWSPTACGRRRCRAAARTAAVIASRVDEDEMSVSGPRAGTPIGRDREAYLPTESPPPGSQARLPPADVDARRPHHRHRAPSSWKAEAVGLIGGVRSRRELDALRVDGLRATAGPLRLSARFDEPELSPLSRPQWRIAFSIPRSVGNAVVRNRARRRLRACFAAIVTAEPDLLPPGTYLVACRRAPRDSTEAHRWLISASRRLMAPSPER